MSYGYGYGTPRFFKTLAIHTTIQFCHFRVLRFRTEIQTCSLSVQKQTRILCYQTSVWGRFSGAAARVCGGHGRRWCGGRMIWRLCARGDAAVSGEGSLVWRLCLLPPHSRRAACAGVAFGAFCACNPPPRQPRTIAHVTHVGVIDGEESLVRNMPITFIDPTGTFSVSFMKLAARGASQHRDTRQRH